MTSTLLMAGSLQRMMQLSNFSQWLPAVIHPALVSMILRGTCEVRCHAEPTLVGHAYGVVRASRAYTLWGSTLCALLTGRRRPGRGVSSVTTRGLSGMVQERVRSHALPDLVWVEQRPCSRRCAALNHLHDRITANILVPSSIPHGHTPLCGVASVLTTQRHDGAVMPRFLASGHVCIRRRDGCCTFGSLVPSLQALVTPNSTVFVAAQLSTIAKTGRDRRPARVEEGARRPPCRARIRG